jgi:hypothetical protein
MIKISESAFLQYNFSTDLKACKPVSLLRRSLFKTFHVLHAPKVYLIIHFLLFEWRLAELLPLARVDLLKRFIDL